jgi:hypothetical protein
VEQKQNKLFLTERGEGGGEKENKYKLVGFRVKARKQPFIVLNLTNNKEYLFTEDLGRKHFKKGEVA